MIRFLTQGPWGGSPKNGGQGPSHQDFEELLRKRQEQIQSIFGKGKGGNGGPGNPKAMISVILILLFVLWAATGFYRIDVKEQAAILRFGEWVYTVKEPGFHFKLPYPIEEAKVANVTVHRDFKIPTTTGDKKYMLTQDLNILDVRITVHWYIHDLGQYLFRVYNPERTIEMAAESVLRDVIARTTLEDAITTKKDLIAVEVQELLQKTVNEYEMGISVNQVNLEYAEPPEPVISAFRDVQSARADQERVNNEALGYKDSIIPVARGDAQKIIQEAEAFRDASVAKAEGKAGRFKQVLREYQKDPKNVRQRLYLEAMEKIYSKTNKVVIPQQGSQGVLPYLPLEALQRKGGASKMITSEEGAKS